MSNRSQWKTPKSIFLKSYKLSGTSFGVHLKTSQPPKCKNNQPKKDTFNLVMNIKITCMLRYATKCLIIPPHPTPPLNKLVMWLLQKADSCIFPLQQILRFLMISKWTNKNAGMKELSIMKTAFCTAGKTYFNRKPTWSAEPCWKGRH